MKRLLLDVNVILDVLLEREPHVEPSGALWALIERGHAQGWLAAHAVTTIHYLIQHGRGRRTARAAIGRLLSVYQVAPVDGSVLRAATGLDCPDFEDAVGAAAAAAAGCDLLVTRDPRGFRGSPVRVVDPLAALAWIAASG